MSSLGFALSMVTPLLGLHSFVRSVNWIHCATAAFLGVPVGTAVIALLRLVCAQRPAAARTSGLRARVGNAGRLAALGARSLFDEPAQHDRGLDDHKGPGERA